VGIWRPPAPTGRLPGFGGAHGLVLHGFVDFVAHDRCSVEKIGRQLNYTTTVMTVGGTIRP